MNTTNFIQPNIGNSSANCNIETSFFVITIIFTLVAELLPFVSKKYSQRNSFLHSIWTLAILSKFKFTKQNGDNFGKFAKLES
jgi:hypothetical protein